MSAATCSGKTARPTSGTNAIRPTPDHASADTSVAPTTIARTIKNILVKTGNSARTKRTTARDASESPMLSAAIAIWRSR